MKISETGKQAIDKICKRLHTIYVSAYICARESLIQELKAVPCALCVFVVVLLIACIPANATTLLLDIYM